MNLEWWHEHGYIAGKQIEGDLWVCVAPMLFTWRLMICTPAGALEFWCYPALGKALTAFAGFDGHGDPDPGWVKHHPSGRRKTEDGRDVDELGRPVDPVETTVD